MVLADGAKDEPCPRPVEVEADRHREGDRTVDEEILPEEQASDHGQIREAGDVDGRHGIAPRTHEGRADEAGQAESEDGQRQTRSDLIGGETQHHDGEEDRHQRPGEHSRAHSRSRSSRR